MTTIARSNVRDQNDAFRTGGPFRGGWFMTIGVQAKGPGFMLDACAAVEAFDDWSNDNDPYDEHDFGKLEFEGETLFWKIDCYDRDRRYGSPDPADPQVTSRVLTLMLASEY